MPRFSSRSIGRLKTCDLKLQQLFDTVVKGFDCTILEGHRDGERQNKLFDEGRTKVRYPHGKHNDSPSQAVDVAPYPLDWNDRDRFHYFAGYVMGIAKQMGISLRFGGDWNMDTQVKDNKFDDLVHFELV
tara:strand:- start:744 stop:1133 length:390 start_codon:yes stop_codon:yes gene_type:complete